MPPKMIRTIIQLPPDLLKQVKDRARAETDKTGEQVSISMVCRKAIKNYLKEASPMKELVIARVYWNDDSETIADVYGRLDSDGKLETRDQGDEYSDYNQTFKSIEDFNEKSFSIYLDRHVDLQFQSTKDFMEALKN
jgi:hypothetical protein